LPYIRKYSFKIIKIILIVYKIIFEANNIIEITKQREKIKEDYLNPIITKEMLSYFNINKAFRGQLLHVDIYVIG
jgi:hypothetical protein